MHRLYTYLRGLAQDGFWDDNHRNTCVETRHAASEKLHAASEKIVCHRARFIVHGPPLGGFRGASKIIRAIPVICGENLFFSI